MKKLFIDLCIAVMLCTTQPVQSGQIKQCNYETFENCTQDEIDKYNFIKQMYFELAEKSTDENIADDIETITLNGMTRTEQVVYYLDQWTNLHNYINPPNLSWFKDWYFDREPLK